MKFSAAAWLASAILLVLPSIQAHSTLQPPLRRISHASEIALDVIEPRSVPSSAHAKRHGASHLPASKRRSPGEVFGTDSIRLRLRAFSQTFHLHLVPNEDLLHPDGTTVNYFAHDPVTGQSFVERTEVLKRGSVRAYHGVVVHPAQTKRRFEEDRAGLQRDWYDRNDEGVVGRAAIILHDDGSTSGIPSFEGTFDWMGNQHYIQTAQNYERKRQTLDPSIHRRDLDHHRLVVHRDSDIMTPLQAREAGFDAVERATSTGCSSDKLDFNSNNHLILSDENNDEGSFSPYSFFSLPSAPASFSRRDMFGGLVDLFGRSGSETTLLQRSEEMEGFSYDDLPGDFLVPYTRRQSTGNDIAGNGASSSYTNSIGSTAGCPNSARVVYMGVASDCTYTARLNGQDNARTEILNNMNSVSNVYRSTFNVSLGVVQLDVRSATCPSTASRDAPWNIACGNEGIDQRLSDFSSWRAANNANGTGLWHLMTACNSGSEIGVAWLGTLCMTTSSSSQGQTVSGAGVSSIVNQQWQVMAHEIGHNFGAIHDCDSGCSSRGSTSVANTGATCCPLSASTCNAGAEYIMNPVSSGGVTGFSQCTIGNICSMLGQGLDTSCVVQPGGRETLSLQQCGNGILEPGEECDAGPNGSRCCSTSCRLTSGALCDPSTSECCTSSCTYAPSTQVCRPAVDGRCDTAETCTGTSATCPEDVRQADGTSCASGGLTCASGRCTSRDLQCQQAATGSMNFTQACSASGVSSCSVTCQDPDSSSRCLILQQTFVDGTSCGYGGRCENGQCRAGSWQDTFKNWYTDNLRISIPVTIIVGIIALAILWGLLRCCFGSVARKGNRRNAASSRWRKTNSPASSFNAHPTQGMSSIPPPPPASARYDSPQRRQAQQPSHWVDPTAWNGPQPNGGASFAPPPGPPPPPAHQGAYQTYTH
ncbi:hypothetical protein IE53DRAFT_371765 [Violaceomyces palustris]|uniref:Uncharacterized protein n=1 Tax=Violaceomyces palustris TaxID=1673888 RepID=A0ACD0NMN3_9BASI|nr:hypothetical protein IE53DRAFT_371765 [Violaceomyces palustris]